MCKKDASKRRDRLNSVTNIKKCHQIYVTNIDIASRSVNPLHLFAEDPYHPPGYAGYVPQKMYRHAGTYGRTTHDILKDERVPYKITRTGKLINFF